MPVSARSEAGLRAQAQALRQYVAARPDMSPADIGAGLARGRAVLEHRAVILAADREELAQALTALAAGEPHPHITTGHTRGSDRGGVVFVFPGQGGQWAGMGLTLLTSSPVFAEHIDACEKALTPWVPWSLTDILHRDPDDPAWQQADVVQPVLFSIMVSLAALWRSYGIEPDAVLGHSQGEIAAAHICGALSLKDAAKTVALRSQALAAVRGRGAMASLPLPAQDVQQLISERWEGQLWVAALNGPHSTTVSGDTTAVEELLTHCADTGLRAKRIPVDYASHCPHVQPLHDELLHLLGDITPQPSTMPFFSTVEGTWLDTTTLDAAYWYRNLHQPVRFSHAIQTLTDDGHRAFIEISPHPTLVPAIEDTTENTTENITATGSLRRGDNDTHRFLTALAHTHTTGIGTPTTWHHHYTQTHPHPHNHHLDLPTYPFQHQHYWLQPPTTTTDLTTTGLTPTHHPLLTATLTLADNNTQLLTGRLSLRTHPWLTDHTVVGTTLVPGTALLELALQATTTDHLEELALHTPLVIPREGAVDVQVHINPPDDTDTRSLTIYSRSENAPAAAPWRHHATAVLGTKTSRIETGRSHDDLSMWPPAGAVRCADEELAALYGDYEANGFVYGPAFRGLTAAWRLGDEVFAEVRLPEQVHGEASAYNLHPALLDAALHAAAFAPSGSLPQGSVPFSFTGVTLHAANASSLRVRLSPADPNSGHAAVSVLVTDDTGTPVASVEALAVRPLAADELRAAERAVQRAELFDMKWVEVPSEGLVSGGASVVVLDGADDLVGLAAEEDGVPGVVVLRCPDAGADGGGGGGGVGEVVGGVLGVVQGWLGLERFAGSRLVVVTRGAVVAGPEDGPVDGRWMWWVRRCGGWCGRRRLSIRTGLSSSTWTPTSTAALTPMPATRPVWGLVWMVGVWLRWWRVVSRSWRCVVSGCWPHA
nr:acyltransferase domain-containing protein [Streptomyces avermitilis]